MRKVKPEESTSRIALAATFVAVLGAPAMAATYKVGADTDPDCTHSTISAALFAAAFSAGPDEIRLAKNQSYTNEFVHLTNFEPPEDDYEISGLTIAGGYATCASSTIVGLTEIDGRAGESTFEIDTAGANRSRVTLRDLLIVGSGIRGVKVVGNSTVLIEGSVIEGNGGGIDVEPGAIVEVDFFTSVRNNRGGFGEGGGIRCWGGRVNLSGVVLNNLAVFGGGLFAGNGCLVDLRDDAFLVSNDATRGGGLYAEGGSFVFSSHRGVAVDFNTAAERGGGIYASGPITTVTLRNVSVDDNQAVDSGAGIFVSLLAQVSVEMLPQCERPPRCSTLSRNSLTIGRNGAAAVAESATLRINQTYIEGNTVPAHVFASVLWGVGSDTLLTTDTVAFWDNRGANTLILAESGATFRADHVSASGNTYTGVAPARPLILTGSATAELRRSIFWPNRPVEENDGTSVADCLIVSDPTGLPAGGLVSTVDPLFRNAAGGDLHLRVESPAVDYCDQGSGFERDIDREFRPYDLAENPNGSPGLSGGVLDIGFDEVVHYFYDGFESGDTSAWDSGVP